MAMVTLWAFFWYFLSLVTKSTAFPSAAQPHFHHILDKRQGVDYNAIVAYATLRAQQKGGTAEWLKRKAA